jgi:hypothetical protein
VHRVSSQTCHKMIPTTSSYAKMVLQLFKCDTTECLSTAALLEDNTVLMTSPETRFFETYDMWRTHIIDKTGQDDCQRRVVQRSSPPPSPKKKRADQLRAEAQYLESSEFDYTEQPSNPHMPPVML